MELVPENIEEIPSLSYNPFEEGTIQEKVEQVRRALEKLPEKYRVVLSLSLFEGYDHDEIGQILGVTPSTSRAQLSRGKQKLLQIMAG